MYNSRRRIEGDLIFEDPKNQWMLHVDKASNINGFGTGLILISPKRWDIHYALRFGFSSSNEAEFEALIASLTITKESVATQSS